MFVETFNKLLKKHDISPIKLAKQINVPKSIVYEWKSGIREPGVDNLLKLSDYFGVSVPSLMGHESSSGEPEEELLVMLRAARNLSQSDHDEMIENFKRNVDLYLRAKGVK